jgi:hypothetical protein
MASEGPIEPTELKSTELESTAIEPTTMEPTEILPRQDVPMRRSPRPAGLGVTLRRRLERLPSLLAGPDLTPTAVAGFAVTTALVTLRIAQTIYGQAARPSMAGTAKTALLVRSFAGSAVLAPGLRVDWTHVEIRWPAG